MPAQCSSKLVGIRRLSDGTLLSERDRIGNGRVDDFAKQAAGRDKVPRSVLQLIMQHNLLLSAVAKWIGQVGVTANHFELPETGDNGKKVFIRDSEGMQSRQSKPRKPRVSKRSREEATVRIPGDLSQCPRWAALRRRIVDKAGIG